MEIYIFAAIAYIGIAITHIGWTLTVIMGELKKINSDMGEYPRMFEDHT